MKLLGAKEFLKTVKSGTLFCEFWMNNEEDCLEIIKDFELSAISVVLGTSESEILSSFRKELLKNNYK